jgi:cytochrome c oxidase assembly protein subunit 15
MRKISRHGTANTVLLWLGLVYLAICSMVVVGGVTRLTGSGLSMVEWRPLMGTLPPLTDSEWQRVFERYKQSPQYQKVNHWMQLPDFKRIFFWEYFHRLLGRLIGVIFIVPWLVFWLRRRFRRPLALKLLVAFALGGLQGLLGWYMVKSGLVDRPAVSHYRLAAHLMLALLLAGWILWILFDECYESRAAGRWAKTSWALLALVVVQTIYGAFMAGTRAGYMYSTFPDMNGELVPSQVLQQAPWWRDLLENPITIHFVHRTLGWLVLGLAAALWLLLRRKARAFDLVAAAVGLQFGLGALTVVFGMPVWLAALHQAGGVALLSVALLVVHGGHPATRPLARASERPIITPRSGYPEPVAGRFRS